MPYTLKNLSGFPLDVPTLSGPVVLPANGEVIAELGALDAEAMRQSPFVEMTEGGNAKPDPLDHDGDGRKGGAAKPKAEDKAEDKARAKPTRQTRRGKKG